MNERTSESGCLSATCRQSRRMEVHNTICQSHWWNYKAKDGPRGPIAASDTRVLKSNTIFFFCLVSSYPFFPFYFASAHTPLSNVKSPLIWPSLHRNTPVSSDQKGVFQMSVCKCFCVCGLQINFHFKGASLDVRSSTKDDFYNMPWKWVSL